MEKKNQVPKYPPLRFPEFTDEWKEVKLGEVGEYVRGLTYNADDVQDTGTIVIRANNLNDGCPIDFKTELVHVSILPDPHQILRNTDITICMANGSSHLVGKASYCCDTSLGTITVGAFCGIFRSTNDLARWIFQTPTYKRYIYKAIQGGNGAIANLKSDDILNQSYFLPSLAEQKKIAALLSLIDERIEVQNAIIKEQEVAKTLLSKELLTPEDDWTEYAVQDCLTYEQPAKYIVKHTDYSSDSTLTPVLTANKGFILGYTSEQGIYQKGACIIFDDFTLDCKYVPFAFKVKSSAIKILQARKGFDIRFMFEVIKSLSLSPFAHKRHYISEVEPIKILVPSFAKQEKIARLFAALDERLAVEKEYAALLQKQKAYLLRQMFV